MKLRILHEDPDRGRDLWRCEDENKWTHSVDFYVDNPSLRDQLTPGCVIEVDLLHPYVEISMGARLVSEDQDG